MKYSDYDDLYKYYLAQQRSKSIYEGNPNIYSDGKQLEIFPETIDKVNNQIPKFVFGTVVYLCYHGKVLMLKQEKEERVVDTLVGLGGKVKATINSVPEENEKTQIDRILKAYNFGSLDTEENMKIAASREVMEETSTYSKDESGKYTHTIIKKGLTINHKLLEPIGISRIRIINTSKTESWLIQNYQYELSEEEYQFIEKEVSKTNREGRLIWLPLEDALPSMSSSDDIVLQVRNPQLSVTEIRDNINKHNILRISLSDEKENYFVTFIDGKQIIDKFTIKEKIPKIHKKS